MPEEFSDEDSKAEVGSPLRVDDCGSDLSSPAMKLEEYPPDECDGSVGSDDDIDQRNTSQIRKHSFKQKT